METYLLILENLIILMKIGISKKQLTAQQEMTNTAIDKNVSSKFLYLET